MSNIMKRFKSFNMHRIFSALGRLKTNLNEMQSIRAEYEAGRQQRIIAPEEELKHLLSIENMLSWQPEKREKNIN